MLLRLLKQIESRRKASGRRRKSCIIDENQYTQSGSLVIDEVQEIIHLPDFDHGHAGELNVDSIVIRPEVVDQLFDYVSNIAAMYHDNYFHNFEHASHVAMSVSKLLSRIVAPSDVEGSGQALHDHTYGITGDPIVQFACVFSVSFRVHRAV